MTDALRDAELLAAAAVQGSPNAFAQYAVQREAMSRAMFEVTDAIASFEWNLDTLRRRHLELNTAMKHEAEYIARLRPLGPRVSPLSWDETGSAKGVQSAEED
jgi:hypothetical protein